MLVLVVIVVLAIVPGAALVAIAVVVIVVVVVVLVAVVVVVVTVFSPASNHLLQLQCAQWHTEPLRQRMSGQPGLREPFTGATAC